VQLSARLIAKVILVSVAVLVVLYLLYLIRSIIGLLVIATFLAVALGPAVDLYQQRARMPRGVAILAVYLTILGAIFGLGLLVVPPIVRGVNNFVDAVPGYVQDLRKNETVRKYDNKYHVTEKLDEQARKLPSRLGDAAGALKSVTVGVFSALFQLVTVLVLTFFLLKDGKRVLEWVQRELGPERGPRMRAVFGDVYSAVGGYVVGNVIISVIAGTGTYVVLQILDVPYAVPLAVLMAFLDLIPLVGATIGGVAIGIVAAIAGILMSALMEGSQIPAFINIPAMLIVFVGTFGVTLASQGMDAMKRLPKLYKAAMSPPSFDQVARVRELVGFAERARREGLLALDEEAGKVEVPFTRKGLQLVVDGTDPDLVADVLAQEIDGMTHRHHEHVQVFEKGGGFAPTLGIIGTVMGLVHVLQNLSAPETLGPSISGAFIATLYGVGMANVVLLPVANRLKQISSQEAAFRNMTLEGILAIQAGDNPRIIADKLCSFIEPAHRPDPDTLRGGAASSGAMIEDAGTAEPALAAVA